MLRVPVSMSLINVTMELIRYIHDQMRKMADHIKDKTISKLET